MLRLMQVFWQAPSFMGHIQMHRIVSAPHVPLLDPPLSPDMLASPDIIMPESWLIMLESRSVELSLPASRPASLPGVGLPQATRERARAAMRVRENDIENAPIEMA
jgi:hypothetical protein